MGEQAVPPQPRFPSALWGIAVSPCSPEAIRRKVELDWGTEDDEYLQKVERNLEKALQEHRPDVVVYNAGTDILEGDRLGGLAISPQVRPDPGAGAGSALGTRQQPGNVAARAFLLRPEGLGSSSSVERGSTRSRTSTALRLQACLSPPSLSPHPRVL